MILITFGIDTEFFIDNILLKNVKILNIYIFSKLVESGFVHIGGFYYIIFSFLFTSKRQYLKKPY